METWYHFFTIMEQSSASVIEMQTRSSGARVIP